jgi:hypothetical protein
MSKSDSLLSHSDVAKEQDDEVENLGDDELMDKADEARDEIEFERRSLTDFDVCLRFLVFVFVLLLLVVDVSTQLLNSS